MKRIVSSLIVILVSAMLYAVPAYNGWQSKVQPDGTSIEVRQTGDEFYHFWETRDGRIALEQEDGTFVVSDEVRPDAATFKSRRSAAIESHTGANLRRSPKAVGTQPNLAPRGVVILVNFSDSQMKSAHTQSVFNNMCNAEVCTTNKYNNKDYPSASQYFVDQSNGAYQPLFDVFGPVNLPNDVKYYGEEGYHAITQRTENDLYLADFVIDAVLAAEEEGCDFSQYDSDNDGWVDFVYIIYAGKGQAYGGSKETIWPHNWSLLAAMYYEFSHGRTDYYYHSNYDYNLLSADGKYIDNYACSSELDGYNQLCGIGTLCHEFGHVMGLPDFYDTQYGEISEQGLTPGAWDIMDAGSYNGNAHCPPNYDPWEKHFFGWEDPVNLGNEASDGMLYANGTEDYNTYQVNASGELQGATESGLCYYIENRQKTGWDEFIPNHGMVVWRVDFDANIWQRNAPNTTGTENAPRFTVESAGEDSWNGVEGKPITEATEKDGKVTFRYMGGGSDTPFEPVWTDWAYYDNGTYQTGVGLGGDLFYWGVLFPAKTLGHTQLSKIAVYETTGQNTKPITIDIYSGGSKPKEENKIYTETVEPAGVNGFHEITLSTPVVFNNRSNLWIVLSADGDSYPALASASTGDPNGRWISTDGTNWQDVASYDLDYTWMIRAFIEAEPEPLPEYFTIRFFNNGEQVGEAQSVLKGTQAEVPTDPTTDCEEYVFAGWWTAELAEDNTKAENWITDFTANADQDYYAIYSRREEGIQGAKASVTFKNAEVDGSTEISTNIAEKAVEAEEGIASYSGSKVFAGTYGVKIGGGSSTGYVILTLSQPVTTNTITVDAKRYKTDTGMLKVAANGTVAFGESQSPSADGGVLTFTTDEAVTINTITVGTTSKRAYIKSITADEGDGSTIYYTSTVNCEPTGLEDIQSSETNCQKELRDGQLVIIRGEAVYTVTGVRIQ